MTDTDKLKRLAENMMGPSSEFWPTSKAKAEFTSLAPHAILALIAARDEAVALLVPLANMATVCGKGADDSVYVGQSGIRLTYGDFRRAFAFLARIDGGV